MPTLGAVVVARDDAQWDIVLGHPSLSSSAGLHSIAFQAQFLHRRMDQCLSHPSGQCKVVPRILGDT